METCVMCVEGTRFKAGSGDVLLVLGLSLVVVGSQCRSGMLNVMRSPRRVLGPFRVGLQVVVLCAARGCCSLSGKTSSRC